MDVMLNKMPISHKIVAVLNQDEIFNRKKIAYEKIKDQIVVPGFRKGHVSQDVAEQKLNVEDLYKSLIDEFYFEVSEKYGIVSAKDFVFFGDLRKTEKFAMEFIGELNPEVELVDLNSLKEKLKLVDPVVSDDDIAKRISLELKQEERIVDSDKQVLENLDVAIIDFEGTIEGSNEPFKGGTAKNYQIVVNELIEGKKNFIDNFEDQIVGMKLNEERLVNVQFPANYSDTLLSEKRVNFKIILKLIKQKIKLDLNEQFISSKGFDTVDAYKSDIKKKIFESKHDNSLCEFKKDIIVQLIKSSNITQIPEMMIENESLKEWSSLLRRVGKTENQMQIEHKFSKESFMQNCKSRSIEVIKASLILSKIALNESLVVDDESVIQYVMKIANILNHDEVAKNKLKKDLESNSYQYNIVKKAALNERTIEFLFNYFK